MNYQHINPKELRAAMQKAKWVAEGKQVECRGVFIGTTMSLAPSGKYYTVSAHSNVTEEEAERDAEFWEQLEREVESLGYSLTSGEGDPADVIVQECQDWARLARLWSRQ